MMLLVRYSKASVKYILGKNLKVIDQNKFAWIGKQNANRNWWEEQTIHRSHISQGFDINYISEIHTDTYVLKFPWSICSTLNCTNNSIRQSLHERSNLHGNVASKSREHHVSGFNDMSSREWIQGRCFKGEYTWKIVKRSVQVQ